jgi:hypothetical protein
MIGVDMKKKQGKDKFDWNKVVEGRKRPVVATVTAALVAWGLGDIWAGLVAGLVIEGVLFTAIWIINKK